MVKRDNAQLQGRGAGRWLIAGVLACVALYFPALGGPLFFDDLPNLVDNVFLQLDGRSFDSWRAAALSSSAGQLERAIPMLTFAVNAVISGGVDAWSIKFTNLVLHCVCAWLIFVLVLQIQRTPAVVELSPVPDARFFAVLAALLWLLHPLQVSTVMYGVQRMAQLSTLFSLVGLWVFLRYRVRWATDAPQAEDLVAAVLWLALILLLAVFSKENGVLLPWLIVVLEVTLMRARWAGQRNLLLQRASWVLLVAPLVLLVLVSMMLPEWLQQRYSSRDFSLEERVLTQGRVLWHYVGWLLTPHVTNLGFFHDDIAVSRGLFAPGTSLVAITAWLGVLVLAIALRLRAPLFSFAVFFFLVAHALESTVIPLEMAYEHRNYLPGVGLVILVSYWLIALGNRLGPQYAAMPTLLVVLALAIMLGIRSYAWRDDLSLARFNVVNHPASARANFYYANALYARYQEAVLDAVPQEERAPLAVGAREYYLAMHALDSDDLAGLVMLYLVDTRHFPRLARDNQWLAKIESVGESRALQRSDVTALGALVSHVMQPEGVGDRARVRTLLAQQQARRPGNLGLLALNYRVLATGDARDRAALQSALKQFVARKPHSRKAVAYLAQFHGQDDLPATYRAVGQWLANDKKRREIEQIHAVFQP